MSRTKKERDPSTDVPADEATKPQKPKKAFEVLVTIYDDGEITNQLREYVKKERGAPEKWLRKPLEFNEAIKKNISENPVLLLEQIAEGLGINLSAFFAARPTVEESTTSKVIIPKE